MKSNTFTTPVTLKACRLLLAAATLMTWINANAATTVCGLVAGERWTAAGSPYRVECDVLVVGLTIEAGVIVEFAGDYELEVATDLRVNGLSHAQVHFRPGSTNRWKGIVFRDVPPGSYLTHAIIEGSRLSGVRITNTPPAFTNCTVRNNTSPGHGGGILADLSGQPLVMHGCLITSNVAGPFNSGDVYGGGIYVADGTCHFKECRIVGNGTQGRQGYGGGLMLHADECLMEDCEVVGNVPRGTVSHYADGIYFNGGTLEMFRCLVATNGVPGASGHGGGLWANGGSAKVWNSRFMGNAHQGMYLGAGGGAATLSVINCTVIGNVHQGLYREGGSINVTNSIVFFNYAAGSDRSAAQITGAASIAFSDVEGGVRPGPGNINFHPALCQTNQSLARGSPCIDMGHPDPSFNDVCINDTLCTPYSRGTVRNDMGAYGGPYVRCDCPFMRELAGQVACVGQNREFCVAVTGAEPLTYQWRYHGTNPGDSPTDIPNATGPCLTLSSVETNHSGYYSVRASNPFCSADSNPALLVVLEACVSSVSLDLYPGLNITGQVGRRYCVRYTTELSENPVWTPLTNFTLTATQSFFYMDPQPARSCNGQAVGPPQRFYSVVECP